MENLSSPKTKQNRKNIISEKGYSCMKILHKWPHDVVVWLPGCVELACDNHP